MKYLACITALLLVAGCSTNPLVPDTKIVKINKPVPYAPPPPDVPVCVDYVATLTPADNKDYGKVAQSYVLTYKCLKETDKTHRQILENYKVISNQAGKVQEMIDSVDTQYENVITPPAKP